MSYTLKGGFYMGLPLTELKGGGDDFIVSFFVFDLTALSEGGS